MPNDKREHALFAVSLLQREKELRLWSFLSKDNAKGHLEGFPVSKVFIK